MSSESTTPTSPISTTEEESTRTMADVVKDLDTEELIDYLQRRDLKLDNDDFKILRREKITGRDFLNTTKEEFRSYGLKGGPAKRLAEFVVELEQKLRTYSSYKTLDDLKEMLRKNKVNGEDITSIKQFTPGKQYYTKWTKVYNQHKYFLTKHSKNENFHSLLKFLILLINILI